MIADVKIAVVDDDPMIRNFVVDVLAYSVNREVMGFGSYADARDHMEESEGGVDIVVCNVDMPGGEGFDLIRRSKETDPARICIALSARASNERRAEQADADGFLAKPFGVSDLFDLVQRFVVGSTCQAV